MSLTFHYYSPTCIDGSSDEDMTNTHTTKAQAKIEFKAQSTLKSYLFASPVRTAGAGLMKTGSVLDVLYIDGKLRR